MRVNTSARKPTSDELLEQIFDCMQELFEQKEFSRTLSSLNTLGKTLVGSDRCSFWYWDKRNHQLWTLAATGVDKIIIPENTGLVGASIMNNEVLFINDPYNDPRFNSSVDKKTGYVTKSILVVPVTNQKGDVIGAYQAINKLYGEEFAQTDVKRLCLAAAFLAKTLESHLLYNEALEDQLTGLRNRRGFFEHYEKAIKPLVAGGIDCSLIICDIDHFKKVNDTYGHNAGDAMLRHVADTFRANTRVDDGVFRWGGEEFIIILPRTDLNGCYEFSERIRKIIEESKCEFEGTTIRATMSFGINSLDRNTTISDTIKAADERLYIAKESGRNRVVRD